VSIATGAIGVPTRRLEGREKVTGQARYAVEYEPDGAAYGWIVQSAVAAGRITGANVDEVRELPGVIAVVWHDNAPTLADDADAELAILQTDRVAYRGQIVAGVVADSYETAHEAAARLRLEYAAESHDVVLREDHPDFYEPEVVNPTYPASTAVGDFDAAFDAAPVKHDAVYRTPTEHNNPMEPHATLALWDGGALTVYDSNQGAPTAQGVIAKTFGIERDHVRVIATHVGGGFGAKGTPRPHVILAAMLAKAAGRPVKLPTTRQQMFAFTGYRTPTIQRIRLACDADGTLTAIGHDVWEQTSRIKEFAEQTATPTRIMYAAANRRTHHELVRLDVPTPSWMRAPGETPGMFALESAMDEIAHAAGIDPIEFRIRNEPESDPESGKSWSSRNLVACLRGGAERFGWANRDPIPRAHAREGILVGVGVASSTYPGYRRPANATATAEDDGTYTVRIGAADIGTGARTALTQIAADALGVEMERVRVEIGDSALPFAGVAGGSMGTASWGTAIHGACRRLIESGEREASYDSTQDIENQRDLARHAFGAQFAEVAVDTVTGEVRLRRMLGVFAAGKIINPLTARSQLIGGMTMGLGMALHEQTIVDREFGDFVNHDLAQYHVPAHADVPAIEAHWIDEDDDELNPMGNKGIGEIGIVGGAAAIANAVFHATGVRFRSLPILPDRVLDALS
jgi:xanthine dehydrogenase YagR molybdenum-binding subunit